MSITKNFSNTISNDASSGGGENEATLDMCRSIFVRTKCEDNISYYRRLLWSGLFDDEAAKVAKLSNEERQDVGRWAIVHTSTHNQRIDNNVQSLSSYLEYVTNAHHGGATSSASSKSRDGNGESILATLDNKTSNKKSVRFNDNVIEIAIDNAETDERQCVVPSKMERMYRRWVDSQAKKHGNDWAEGHDNPQDGDFSLARLEETRKGDLIAQASASFKNVYPAASQFRDPAEREIASILTVNQ
ncbi:hypothetical protein [Burkholderia pyrrocinia]